MVIMMVARLLHGMLTTAGGSKRHAEQQAYEERLDGAMKRMKAGKEQ